MVLPLRGLTGQSMGLHQTEQPMIGKEGVGPSQMVPAAGSASAVFAPAQDRAQALAYPAVQTLECPPPAVLEVREPAPQRPVDVGDDERQRVPRRAAGLRPEGVL